MFEIFQEIQPALLGGLSGCCIDNRLRVVVMQVTQFLNGADRIRERSTGGNQEKLIRSFRPVVQPSCGRNNLLDGASKNRRCRREEK